MTMPKLDPADDAEEWTDHMLDQAEHRVGEEVIHRGSGRRARPGRPLSTAPKQQVTIRLDQDVIERFRGSGRGWQTRINDALRRALED